MTFLIIVGISYTLPAQSISFDIEYEDVEFVREGVKIFVKRSKKGRNTKKFCIQKKFMILKTLCSKKNTILSSFKRTASTDQSGDYEAKSRLVLPGHLLAKGAQYGHERTDSPTASLTSTYVGLAIAAIVCIILGPPTRSS